MKPLVGLLAIACGGLAAGQGVFGLPASSSNVRYQTLGSGTDAKTNAPGIYLFNEPTGWDNYWRAHHPGPVPKLQPGFFQNWRILAVHAGTRPTAGYSLGVLRIQRRIDKATITALETIPPRGARNAQVATSPWIILQVERGAFDFDLQTQRVAGYPTGGQVVEGGSTVKIGGATVTFGPGYGYGGGCDHCRHRGRDGCHCQSGGKNCDCSG